MLHPHRQYIDLLPFSSPTQRNITTLFPIFPKEVSLKTGKQQPQALMYYVIIVLIYNVLKSKYAIIALQSKGNTALTTATGLHNFS
jgi:hypothetical protein